MRVLLMGNNDKLGGGLGIHYVMLSKYLKKMNYEIACININNGSEKNFNNNSIPEFNIIFHPHSLIAKAKKYFQLRKAIFFAKKFDPNIFIATALGNGYAMIASHLSSDVFKIYQEVQTDVRIIPLRLKMIKIFDAVGSQTEKIATQFIEKISQEIPIRELPCFSKDFFVNTFQEIPAIENGIRLAFFGRLAANKGVKEFISATKSIFIDNSNLKFDIFGKGPELEAIQEEISKNFLNDQIQIKGFYSDEEFPKLISSYHGIIIPSIDSEGLPLILIESMRFGRPVLGTTIGAMSEVKLINKEGIIITMPSEEGFYESLNLFLTSIESKEFDAKYIYDIYINHYSNDAFLKKWELMLNDPKHYFLNKELAYA